MHENTNLDINWRANEQNEQQLCMQVVDTETFWWGQHTEAGMEVEFEAGYAVEADRGIWVYIRAAYWFCLEDIAGVARSGEHPLTFLFT